MQAKPVTLNLLVLLSCLRLPDKAVLQGRVLSLALFICRVRLEREPD